MYGKQTDFEGFTKEQSHSFLVRLFTDQCNLQCLKHVTPSGKTMNLCFKSQVYLWVQNIELFLLEL